MNQYEKRIALVDDYLNRLALPNEIIEYYRGRSILVTGGAGAIGSNLIIALSELVGDDGKVVILDNLARDQGRRSVECGAPAQRHVRAWGRPQRRGFETGVQ